VAFIAYLVLHAGELLEMLAVDWHAIGAIGGLTLLIIWLQTLVSASLVRSLVGHHPFLSLFGIQLTSVLLNYLPLKAGTLVRARAYKHLVGIGYTQFAGLFMVAGIYYAIGSLLVALVAVSVLDGIGASATWLCVLSISAAVLLLFCLLLMPVPRLKSVPLVGSRMDRLIACRACATGDRLLMAKLVFLSVLIAGASGFGMHFSFQCVTAGVSLPAALLIGCSGTLTNLVMVTPGGIGVREPLFGLLTVALGQPYGSGFLAATLFRVVSFVVHLVAGSIALPWTFWQLRARSAPNPPTAHDG
jgi:uncharacterized membrane protein YbhN (UPF0104 family)